MRARNKNKIKCSGGTDSASSSKGGHGGGCEGCGGGKVQEEAEDIENQFSYENRNIDAADHLSSSRDDSGRGTYLKQFKRNRYLLSSVSTLYE